MAGMKTVSGKWGTEAFNSRASEAIREAVLDRHVSLGGSDEPARLIDFEDETEIVYGDPSEKEDGMAIPFEVGGIGEFYFESVDDSLPREEKVPCVCRGELLASEAGAHAPDLDVSIRVSFVDVGINETLTSD